MSCTAILIRTGISGMYVTALLYAMPATAQADETTPSDAPSTLPIAPWVDQKHAKICQILQTQANIMDAWFGTGATRAPQAKIKLLLDHSWDKHNGLDASIRVRGSLRLPNASKRFRLMFGDDTIEDEQAAGLSTLPTVPHMATPNSDPTTAGKTNPTLQSINAQALKDNASIAIRLLAPLGQHVTSDVDIGIRAGTDVYARAEVGKTWPIDANNNALLHQTVRFGLKSELYARTDFELQYVPMGQPQVFYHTSMTYAEAEEDKGLSWTHRISRQHIVATQAVWSYGLQVNEHVQDQDLLLDSYGPWMSWEQPVWRDWIRLRGDVNYFNDRPQHRGHYPSAFVRLQANF
jgi:hypothetical protein